MQSSTLLLEIINDYYLSTLFSFGLDIKILSSNTDQFINST